MSGERKSAIHIHLGAVGLAAALLLAVAWGAESLPATDSSAAADAAASTSRIAYISSSRAGPRGGNNPLYVVNADGRGQRLLTRKAWQELSWSPDGRKITFLSVRDRNSEIYVVRADGGGQRRLTRSSDFEFFPSWSPDGRKIAFGSLRGGPQGRSEIYVMNADGSGRRLLTPDGQDPIWLPGGRQIAFTRIPAGLVPFEFLAINADDSGERNLTREWGIDNGPAWSPDGQKIVFGSSRDGNPEIYVMNADGTGVRRLTRNPAADVDHWWSPDGRKIAFVRQTGGTAAIYVMNADGSGQRRLARNGRHPHWSPDGRMIAFARRHGGNWEIYLMDGDGTGQRNLTRTPKSNEESHFAWSPRQEKRRSSMRGISQLARDVPSTFRFPAAAESTSSVYVLPRAEYRARAHAICKTANKGFVRSSAACSAHPRTTSTPGRSRSGNRHPDALLARFRAFSSWPAHARVWCMRGRGV